MKFRMVNVIHGKKAKRMVVICPSCPIDPNRMGVNQKTACLHIVNRTEDGETRMIKEQQCIYYGEDSIKRSENDIATIVCLY